MRDALAEARAVQTRVRQAIEAKRGDAAKLQSVWERLTTRTGPYEDQMFVDQLSNVNREISEADSLCDDDLAPMRRLRARLHAVFAAADDAEAVRLVNSLVADARTTPRLTDHDGWPLHIHYYAPGVRLAEHLAADCGMALAFVIAAGERSRLATCAAPEATFSIAFRSGQSAIASEPSRIDSVSR